MTIIVVAIKDIKNIYIYVYIFTFQSIKWNIDEKNNSNKIYLITCNPL